MHLLVNGRRVKASQLSRYPITRREDGKLFSIVGFEIRNKILQRIFVRAVEDEETTTLDVSEFVINH